MFRLTREVRLALNDPGTPSQPRITNSFAGYPTLAGIAPHLAMRITLEGSLQPHSSYLRNIKDIDDVVRREVIGLIYQWRERSSRGYAIIPARLLEFLRGHFADIENQWLFGVEICLSPTVSVSCSNKEHPMVLLSQKFEFCAAHRLNNPSLSEEQNRKIFGKCNNPQGHGHNYQLQVTLRGVPGSDGSLIDLPAFEQIVNTHVIERLDHKNLNIEIPEFKTINPTVENIAAVIYRLLDPPITQAHAHTSLASVTVWESGKTWCEYSED